LPGSPGTGGGGAAGSAGTVVFSVGSTTVPSFQATGSASNTGVAVTTSVVCLLSAGTLSECGVANGEEVASSKVFLFSSTTQGNGSADTGISRDAAGVVDVGTGAQGSKAGQLNAATINATSSFQANGTAGLTQSGTLCSATITLSEGLVTACTAVSDPRVKNIHGPFQRGLVDLMKLQPIEFDYNKTGLAITGEEPGKTHYGFNADNVKAAIPEAVSTETRCDDDPHSLKVNRTTPCPTATDYNAVNPNVITATLVTAMQEYRKLVKGALAAQKKRITLQEAEIAVLKAEVEALKKR
jgi:hypothetical protein